MASRRRILLLPFAAGGCALLPGSGDPAQLYTLTPKSTFAPDLPRVAVQLMVDLPVAAQGLNTPRIALQRSAVTLDYYANAAWTDLAPAMVQALLVESFENSGRILAVARETTQLRPDFLLMSELREFQALYQDVARPPTVRVRMFGRLVRLPDRSIVATHAADAMERAAGINVPQVVAAFDEALGKVLRRLVEWALRAMAAQPPAGGR